MVGWTTGTVVEARAEGRSGRVLLLDVPGWGGNLAGQHLDLRLTAPDGYQAARSYSVASVGPGDRVELAVDRLPGGEVSPYLVDEVMVGDEVEVRGPLGGWFVWRPEQEGPVQLIAGGSGVVPLVAMVRARLRSDSTSPFRLLYSVRTPEDVFFRSELESSGEGVEVTWAYTRTAPEGWPRSPGRVGRAELEERCFRPEDDPAVYVCGPTAFVESVASTLVELGHDARRIKTERFGGT
ncbi:ferredoxin reductase [Naasia sp. SYSU D00057]|uniref:ferredoxin reductase n=1 Tax=Naasia sp. SYSU D00057 TaxID=2817380 RepID=UPI0027DDD544|nr:ferredoxin reductase [Naasia sp. SYSU D00057]